jgi:hypothetical protein
VRSRGGGRRRFGFPHGIEESRCHESNLMDLALHQRSPSRPRKVAILLTKDGPLVAMDCIGMLEGDQLSMPSR